MVVLDKKESGAQWAITSRFRLEIALINEIDTTQPKEIWFNYGVFILTSYSQSTSGAVTNISLSGKDKMCMLNGECGGKFHAQIDFGKEEIATKDANGNAIITTNKIPIRTIILKMLQQYGNESLHNIIIEDLEDYGLQLLEYRGEGSLYLVRRWDQDFYSNIYIQDMAESTDVYVKIDDTIVSRNITDLPVYDELLMTDFMGSVSEECKINFDTNQNWSSLPDSNFYAVAKLSYGETAGYYQIKLVYPGELIANVGETITSVLDKIKNMLGDFEYFYDKDGHFIFRRQRSYTGVAWTPLVSDDQDFHINEGLAISSAVSARLDDDKLITQLSINPSWSNLANDFSIWGERTGVSGAKLPIHIRYAIDTKPTYYKSIAFTEQDLKTYNELQDIKVKYADYVQDSTLYFTDAYQGELGEVDLNKAVDWRELIYQMARDWYKGNYLDDFTYRLTKNNPWIVNGKTKYEQYYPDLMSFWRQLYNPNKDKSFESVVIKTGIIQYKDWNQLSDRNNVHLYDKNGIRLETKTWTLYDDEIYKGQYFYKIENEYDVFTNALYEPGEATDTTRGRIINAQLPKNYYKDSNEEKIIHYFRNGQRVYYYKNYIIGFEDDNGDGYICLPSSNSLVNLYLDDNKTKIYLAYRKNNFWYYTVDASTVNLNNGGYYTKNGNIFTEVKVPKKATPQYYRRTLNFYTYIDKYNEDGFIKEIEESPQTLNFWFDFLDPNDTLLEQSGVKVIGDRLYAQKDQDMGSIYYKQTPNLIYTLSDDEELGISDRKTGYVYINLQSSNKNLFSVSSKKKTGIETIQNLIYSKNYIQQPVNLTIIPNYKIEPGSRIYLKNKDNNLDGEYLVDKISFGLDYSALMQLSLTKAPDRLL